MTTSPMAAAASSALRPLLAGPPRHGVVLAAVTGALHVVLDDGEVLAVVTRDAVALPNALVLAVNSDPAPFAGVRPGAVVRCGAGGLTVAAAPGVMVVRVGRWWDPVPAVVACDPARLADAIEEVARTLPPWPDPRLDAAPALRARAGRLTAALREGMGVEDAAAGLIGLGPGLTPSGDDVLVGAIVAVIVLGAAVGHPAADWPHRSRDGRDPGAAGAPPATMARFRVGGVGGAGMAVRGTSRRGAGTGLDAVGDALAAQVVADRGRTTTVSAALLAHACRGEVAAPLGAVLRELMRTGCCGSEPRDDTRLGVAVTELLAVGGSSGGDLAVGVVVGGRAVVAASTVAVLPGAGSGSA